MDAEHEKKCPLCDAVLEGVELDASGEFRCRRCGSTCRYQGVDLVAMFIPGFHRRMMELESMNKELISEIEMEGMKGAGRNLRYLQEKHLERQDVLAECSFLSLFREFVNKW